MTDGCCGPAQLWTGDIYDGHVDPGTDHHAFLIDLLAACRGPRDRETLRLRLGHNDLDEIGERVGRSRWAVSRALSAIFGRAR